MHIRILAVGDRQPSWVEDAFNIYISRYPREWKFQFEVIPTKKRSKNDKSFNAQEAESERILSKFSPTDYAILLDECGTQLSSKSLASKLSDWQLNGFDLCFIIGGPDGVSEKLRNKANMIWSLSNLTLHHGMARVLLAEQLYRAYSIQVGHPYHRE
ncbi:MAG: 23S rRNA (pseudouridine(1915)-N(3))-methyltransferase RlmH [Woeseia sp.]|nr:23S rRNA (pseudouridine(1915)-N(3))-methyltransferase RlmH [Woeseia sp.]